MGLFSYFAEKKEEQKNREYIDEGKASAPKYFTTAQRYLDRTIVFPPRPKEITYTKEPTPEELARQEAEWKRLQSQQKNNFDSTPKYSLATDCIGMYSDQYEMVYRSPEELAKRDLMETAKKFVAVSHMPGMDTPFIVKVHQYMAEKKISPAEMYRRAQLDKTTFSKLSNNLESIPTKDTAIALALGLELSLPEASDLLKRCGYALSHSVKQDIIIEYCFANRIYNVITVNCILDELNLKPLGRKI